MILAVKENKGTITLDSGMSESAFGKTRLNIKDKGYVAKMLDNGHYRFDTWQFSSVTVLENAHAAFQGTCFEGETLANIIEKGGGKARSVCVDVCRALKDAAGNNPIPRLPGAGGIIIESTSARRPDILFLPAGLFASCAAASGEEEMAMSQGYWINERAASLSNIAFMQAVLSYRVLTGAMPYPNKNTNSRLEDISDSNFIPVECAAIGIDKTLARAIDASLLNAFTSGEAEAKSFPVELLEKELGCRKRNVSAAMEAEAARIIKKQKNDVRFRRVIRKHTAFIVAALIAFIAACALSVNIVKARGKQPVSTGLSSIETVLSFYQGMDRKNTDIMEGMTQGGAGKAYINSVSAIFVMSRVRQAYENMANSLSPAQWVSKHCPRNTPVYGISRLSVDGKEADIESVRVPLRNMKRRPVAAEGGRELIENDREEHVVRYCLVFTQGETFTVQSFTDKVTLTYKKGSWHISALDGDAEDIEVDEEEFHRRFEEALESKRTLSDALSSVLPFYPWLPSCEDAERAASNALAAPEDT